MDNTLPHLKELTGTLIGLVGLAFAKLCLSNEMGLMNLAMVNDTRINAPINGSRDFWIPTHCLRAGKISFADALA